MTIADYLAGIDGVQIDAAEGMFAVENPATTEPIAHVRASGAADATAAVDRAVAAQPEWAARAPRERAEALVRTRELMLRDADQLAELIANENGKSLSDARSEVVYAAEFFRWYAEEAVRPGGDFGSAPAGGTRTIVTSRPVGVAALVTPWNFPAAMATRKIAPALAAGCAVVLKPAQETPLTAFAVARLLVEAGVPAELVNIVVGEDAGTIVSTWLEDARVRKISFTGSTRVGQLLLRQAADRVVNTSMELGGAAPFIVAASADVDAAVDGAMLAKFRNGGQACTAANCFFVHESVAEEFTATFGAKVSALQVGAASDGAEIGPLITAKAKENMVQRLDDAVAAGAQVAHQASAPQGAGHFVAPTILTGVAMDSPLVTTETFGPIAPIVTFTSSDELMAALAELEFGLSAYVYGELGEALHLAERLDCGMVGVNRGLVSDPAAPFGGTKQSGIGREGARMGLEEYQETQYFSVAW